MPGRSNGPKGVDDELVLVPRLRVLRGETIVIGPGKVDLLDAIAASGSIRKAAASLGMSYMRAWELVQVMNRSFREPLVVSHRGGSGSGGATLTETGEAVRTLYRSMEKTARKAMATDWRRLRKLAAARIGDVIHR